MTTTVNQPLRTWHVALPIAASALVLWLMCGCTTVNLIPDQVPAECAPEFRLADHFPDATKMIGFEWDAPTCDAAGQPLDGTLCYEVDVNGNKVVVPATFCHVEDTGGVLLAKVRASCNGNGGQWSDWSEPFAYRFSELAISGDFVSWVALPPLSYSLLWTPSFFSGFSVVKSSQGAVQIETYPLTGEQGFYELPTR